MSVSTQHTSGTPASGRAQPNASGQAGAQRRRIRARRRTVGATLGSIPVANIVVIEVGLALGLMVVVATEKLFHAPIMLALPIAVGVVAVAVLIALLRSRGRWFIQWVGLVMEYRTRTHTRVAEPPVQDEDDEAQPEDDTIIGANNHRVSLLRLAVEDLVVARSQDHDRNPVGIAWHDGKWTAVLGVEPAPSLLNPIGAAPNLPMGALAPCLEDRGVVLDTIQVIWHCYPGGVYLPSNSPALNAYLELLGPLPAAARRTTWVAVRLDPQRCSKAIGERGGGVVGAHRALIGALSRVRSALEQQDVPTRPLGPDELLHESIVSAELQQALREQRAVGLKERWSSVTAGGVGHASYAITRWPSQIGDSLNALTGLRALSSSIALSISPSGEDGEVGLRGVVRVSSRIPEELDAAGNRLQSISRRLGLTLTPLRGLQLTGFVATLPVGGAS